MGKVKVNNSDYTWTLMHLNFRGYSSKKLSFESMIWSFSPPINYINTFEIHIGFKKSFQIPGYQCFFKNRNSRGP